jgi:hypothetical protein
LPFAELANPQLRIGVLGAAGWDAAMRLDYERALELATMALRLTEEDPESGWTAASAAVATGGVVGIYTGRFEAASELTARFLAQQARSGQPDDFVTTSTGTVPIMAALCTGDHAAARAGARRALADARRVGSPSGLALCLYVFGWVWMYDDPAAALEAFDESMALMLSGASDQTLVHVLLRAGIIRAGGGDRSSLADLRRAMQYADDVGSLISTMAVLDYGFRILADVDEADTGAVIVGFLGTGDISLSPVFGPEAVHRERALERLEHDLGPAGFEAAKQRGAAMSYRELSQFVLERLAGAPASVR